MQPMPGLRIAIVITGIIFSSAQAFAGQLTFQLIASFGTNVSPFGLAFDGTSLWYGSAGDSLIREMSTSGVNTGRTTANPLGSAMGLAWTGGQLVAANGSTIGYFDRVTGANYSAMPITAAVTGSGTGAGLDFGQNEIWYDQDRSNVFRLTAQAAFAPGPMLRNAFTTLSCNSSSPFFRMSRSIGTPSLPAGPIRPTE